MESIPVIEKKITVPGITREYRILHVTDSHVVLWDERDEHKVIKSGAHKGKRLCADFGSVRYPHFSRNGVTSAEHFAYLCDQLAASPDFCDAVVFTGDILDFYTEAAFDFVCQSIAKLPMPYIFTLGNHDLIFSDMEEAEVRAKFVSLCGGDTRIQKLKVGELMLLGADNIRNYYADETVAGIRDVLGSEKNVLMFQHLPLSTPELHEVTMAKKGRDLGLGGDGVCIGDSHSIVRDMITADNSPVRALICGDMHLDFSGKIGNADLFVSPITVDFPPVLFTVSA